MARTKLQKDIEERKRLEKAKRQGQTDDDIVCSDKKRIPTAAKIRISAFACIVISGCVGFALLINGKKPATEEIPTFSYDEQYILPDEGLKNSDEIIKKIPEAYKMTVKSSVYKDNQTYSNDYVTEFKDGVSYCHGQNGDIYFDEVLLSGSGYNIFLSHNGSEYVEADCINYANILAEDFISPLLSSQSIKGDDNGKYTVEVSTDSIQAFLPTDAFIFVKPIDYDDADTEPETVAEYITLELSFAESGITITGQSEDTKLDINISPIENISVDFSSYVKSYSDMAAEAESQE